MRIAVPGERGVAMALRVDYRAGTQEAALRLGWEWTGDTAAAAERNRTREVYLPAGERWVDFWTGEPVEAGLHAWPVRLDRIPLFVRAGSILPLGPSRRWADEPVAEPIEVRIYPGRDAGFALYDDAGDGYAYERGACAIVGLAWNDAHRTLRFGDRQGAFPGMRVEQAFTLVIVRPGRGVGAQPEATPDRRVTYTGKAMDVALSG